MKVEHISTTKGWNGVFDLEIIVSNSDGSKKEYTYHIPTEKTIDTFLFYIGKKWYGKALNLLKKNNINEEEKI